MNRGEFTREVFKAIGAPIDGGRLAFGVAWAAFENTTAKNNPWATTQPFSNATDFNETGVKNYETWEDGVSATVQTLENGDYEFLLKTLRNPHSTIRQCLNALDAAPWGSHPTPLLWQSVVKNYDHYNTEVYGSGSGLVAPNLNTFITINSGNASAMFSSTAPEVTIPPSEDVQQEEKETVVDDESVETPEVDTLESRLANAPKPKTIQEQLDEANGTEANPSFLDESN